MDNPQEKNVFNLKEILLPKKEGRTPASASRLNAGVLLENEQGATLPKQEAAPIIAPQAPQGPVDDAKVKPLQTFQSDIDSVITQKNVSEVSMITAEMQRAQKDTSLQPAPARDWSGLVKLSLILASVILLTGAAAALGFVFLRPASSIFVEQKNTSPFIAVDNTAALILKPEQFNRATLMQNLNTIRQKPGISLGLMERVYVAVSTSTTKNSLPPALTAQDLLSHLAPNVSGELLRSLNSEYYLLGTHVFDGDQAFLVLRVEFYELAFSGMLAWENTMTQELMPLFSRDISPTIGSTASTTTAEPSFLLTRFRDRIVGNQDARVVENASGDILLLWTFLDRNTLVITTNEWTLKEIIARRYTFTPTP